MRVTRYPQSCMVLEDNGNRLVIDPGSNFTDSHEQGELAGVTAVLYTHKHPDHIDLELDSYLRACGAARYGNQATADAAGDQEMHVVSDGDGFKAAGFEIQARELPHCPMPDGSAGPQNTGYVINGVFFHPGDGKELAGLRVENLALPIQGPDVSFRDANDFAKQVGASVVIPMHYDLMGANPDRYKKSAEGFQMQFAIRVLGDGESTDL